MGGMLAVPRHRRRFGYRNLFSIAQSGWWANCIERLRRYVRVLHDNHTAQEALRVTLGISLL